MPGWRVLGAGELALGVSAIGAGEGEDVPNEGEPKDGAGEETGAGAGAGEVGGTSLAITSLKGVQAESPSI